MERLQNGTGLTTGPARNRDDNISVTKTTDMLTPQERQELLQKHQNAQFKNKMRLLLLGGLLAFAGTLGVAYEPSNAAAYVIVILLGLCSVAIGSLD